MSLPFPKPERWSSKTMAAVVGATFLGCSGGSDLEPSPHERTRLEAHLSAIFADVEPMDEAQLEADRVRARHVHQLGYWAQRFHDRKGYYPLASPDSSVFRQTLIGSMIPNVEGFGDTYVAQESLLAELREVLGPEVSLPEDPIPEPDGSRAYAYGVYGHAFVAAAMLYHPAGWSEGILPRQWQYRVGAVENPDLPILQISLLLEGAYAEPRRARWRDPAMALQ
jgi:hypothetical protein